MAEAVWRASVFTLFPAMFPGPLGLSLAGDALARGVWRCDAHDIRDHGLGRHRTVDDRPAGGGPGMVMRADVVAAALDAALPADDPRPRLMMSPRGAPLTQRMVGALAEGPGVVVVCGRFEGIDERVIAARGLREVSIGDFVLSGGELGALVLLDAVVRLLPGVMGAATSGTEESFEGGLLEYPHFTRPRDFEGQAIPDVLVSGDHGRIAAWRRAEALRITRERRPDLIEGRDAMSKKPDTHPPAFAAAFSIDAADATSISIRHATEGHWWRFEVGETNGRRLLVHAEHRAGSAATRDIAAYALDAFDAATREARERGMVD